MYHYGVTMLSGTSRLSKDSHMATKHPKYSMDGGRHWSLSRQSYSLCAQYVVGHELGAHLCHIVLGHCNYGCFGLCKTWCMLETGKIHFAGGNTIRLYGMTNDDLITGKNLIYACVKTEKNI